VSEHAPDEQFEALVDFIKRNRGFDFTGYKRPSLMRRIDKRMATVGIADYADYMDYLAASPDEFAPLFDTILINVTSFFRDPAAWEYLGEQIVPRLAESLSPDARIRIWSVGCATGEEAFTAAMVVAEVIGEDAFLERVKIYATDVDEAALGQGRHAAYTAKDVAPVPPDLRARYFEQTNGGYTFRSDLRRSVIFGRHDLIQDPPISRIDLLLARNTLMYFTPETQGQVLAQFHFALNESGYLFLGKSEVLLTRSNLFQPVDLRRRVFRPTAKVSLRDRLLTMVEGGERESRPAVEGRVRETAFEASPFPQLVVDRDGTVVLVNLQARMLFGLTGRDIGRPLKDLQVSFRPVDLRTPIARVEQERRAVSVRDVEWADSEREPRFYDVNLMPIGSDTDGPAAVAVTFIDVTRHRHLTETVEHARRELETAYEELQSTAEELETTNEELQSTNEELETTNEELQSTNEELETMNEELQSSNEELETLNDELRKRTDDLDHVNLFLESILGSLDEAVMVVDGELRVQAWNERAEEMWGLRANEVNGQHVLGLDIGLPVGELGRPMRRVLADEGPERLSLEAVNRRGRRVHCDIALRPLLGADGHTEGLIVLVAATAAPADT
jgi:two-component system CheB/CheR fusion protein